MISIEKDIEDYCKLNEIDDIEEFKKECLKIGFNVTKYGLNPSDNIRREKVEESEKEIKAKEEPKKTRKSKIRIIKN